MASEPGTETGGVELILSPRRGGDRENPGPPGFSNRAGPSGPSGPSGTSGTSTSTTSYDTSRGGSSSTRATTTGAPPPHPTTGPGTGTVKIDWDRVRAMAEVNLDSLLLSRGKKKSPSPTGHHRPRGAGVHPRGLGGGADRVGDTHTLTRTVAPQGDDQGQGGPGHPTKETTTESAAAQENQTRVRVTPNTAVGGAGGTTVMVMPPGANSTGTSTSTSGACLARPAELEKNVSVVQDPVGEAEAATGYRRGVVSQVRHERTNERMIYYFSTLQHPLPDLHLDLHPQHPHPNPPPNPYARRFGSALAPGGIRSPSLRACRPTIWDQNPIPTPNSHPHLHENRNAKHPPDRPPRRWSVAPPWRRRNRYSPRSNSQHPRPVRGRGVPPPTVVRV